MPVSREELEKWAVDLNWKVEERHYRRVTVLDLLLGADFNEEEWTNEDGSIRFETVEEAFEWATTRKEEGGSGFLDGQHGEDWLMDMAGPNTWTQAEVDGFDTDVDLLSPAALAREAAKQAEAKAEYERKREARRAATQEDTEGDG